MFIGLFYLKKRMFTTTAKKHTENYEQQKSQNSPTAVTLYVNTEQTLLNIFSYSHNFIDENCMSDFCNIHTTFGLYPEVVISL